VRYALHRLFVQRHAWYIRGLEPDGKSLNASSPTEALEDHLPSYVQGLLESRLQGHGFTLHDAAVFAATLEHLIHKEAEGLTEHALNVHDFSGKDLTQAQVDAVLDTYMKIYIMGETAAQYSDEQVDAMYPSWQHTKVFVRDMRNNVVYSEVNRMKSSDVRTFTSATVTRIVEEVAEHYGVFQDSECKQIKNDLLKYGDRDTGLVPLSSFYQAALDHGSMTFNEPKEYLRELGALDESDPANPRVIVPNYITGKSNCILTSGLYSVCCINECEPLLGHLEREIASPEASPTDIAELVAKMSSSTVEAPRTLSAPLLYKLSEIAEGHGGTVPLHGRLFSQWMHHAFPRECPYPHVSGTSTPKTPSEWMEENGQTASASHDEMTRIVNDAQLFFRNETVEGKPLLWSPEEELIELRRAPASRIDVMSCLRRAAELIVVASGIIYLIQKQKSAMSCPGKWGKSEKHIV
jgi:hypothetical protein